MAVSGNLIGMLSMGIQNPRSPVAMVDQAGRRAQRGISRLMNNINKNRVACCHGNLGFVRIVPRALLLFLARDSLSQVTLPPAISRLALVSEARRDIRSDTYGTQ
jgi:hypothetical protein